MKYLMAVLVLLLLAPSAHANPLRAAKRGIICSVMLPYRLASGLAVGVRHGVFRWQHEDLQYCQRCQARNRAMLYFMYLAPRRNEYIQENSVEL